jgi:hypothetical protein
MGAGAIIRQKNEKRILMAAEKIFAREGYMTCLRIEGPTG